MVSCTAAQSALYLQIIRALVGHALYEHVALLVMVAIAGQLPVMDAIGAQHSGSAVVQSALLLHCDHQRF